MLNDLSRLLQLAAARHTAALVVAKVAAIELPRGEWRELIATLLANMSTTPPNSGLQQATLQALGYVCEEMGYLADDVLDQEQINSILTAVVQVCCRLKLMPGLSCRACHRASLQASDGALQGMRKEEQDNDVRLAATQALYNAIEFASTNFRNETERNYLMQVLSQSLRGRGCAQMCVVPVCTSPVKGTAVIRAPVVPCYQLSAGMQAYPCVSPVLPNSTMPCAGCFAPLCHNDAPFDSLLSRRSAALHECVRHRTPIAGATVATPLASIFVHLQNVPCAPQVICEAATGATPALRESAYECMVKIVPNYYDTLPPYMETIFSLTKHAIEKDEEEVAKQAIEFWSSICEEEIDLIDVRLATVCAFISVLMITYAAPCTPCKE